MTKLLGERRHAHTWKYRTERLPSHCPDCGRNVECRIRWTVARKRAMRDAFKAGDTKLLFHLACQAVDEAADSKPWPDTVEHLEIDGYPPIEVWPHSGGSEPGLFWMITSLDWDTVVRWVKEKL